VNDYKQLLFVWICFVLLVSTCDNSKPPDIVDPPDPTTTTTTEPPAPSDPQPSDYYTLERAGTYVPGAVHCREHTGMVRTICEDLCPWACWRDPAYVVNNCPWSCADGSDPMFDLTELQMHRFASRGLDLNAAGDNWMRKLPVVNRRCASDSRFCGRSEVRKADYPPGISPAYKQWRSAFEAHKTEAYRMRDTAQADPISETCAYDSVAGWCQCRNK